MIIKNGILMICYRLAWGLHHILRECSCSHNYEISDTRDGHMVYFGEYWYTLLLNCFVKCLQFISA